MARPRKGPQRTRFGLSFFLQVNGMQGVRLPSAWQIRTEASAIAAATLVGLTALSVYLVFVRVLFFHRTALSLFQWDASNALGARAIHGGLWTGFVGLLMDIAVTLIWAALYVAAARRFDPVLEHPTLAGAVYGAFVMAVMFGIIVPLGNAAHGAMSLPSFSNTLIAHVGFFGIPVAWTTTVVMRRSGKVTRKLHTTL